MTEKNQANSSPSGSFWRNAPAPDIAGRAAIDHSLAFHRLQEARQELYLARSESAALPPRERDWLIAYCEANLVSAEQWVARTSGPKSEPTQDPPG